MPRLKWHERLLCWLLFRIEAKHGFGSGGFDRLNIDAMKWLLDSDHMSYGVVCGLMRDYVYTRMAHEREKERRNA